MASGLAPHGTPRPGSGSFPAKTEATSTGDYRAGAVAQWPRMSVFRRRMGSVFALLLGLILR